MTGCNQNLAKATDPKYICNPETKRWNLKPEFKKGYVRKVVVKKIITVVPLLQRKKIINRKVSKMLYNASIKSSEPQQINLEEFVRNFNLTNGFSSKRYVRRDRGELFVYFDPPNKTLPGTECSYQMCGKKDGVPHTKTCSTQLIEHLFISDNGLTTSLNKEVNDFINKQRLSDDTAEQLINGDEKLGYTTLFPKAKVSDEWTIENMVTLVFNGTKVRVASDASCHILYGPDTMDPKKVYRSIFRKESGSLKYTMKRFTYTITTDTINMDLLDSFLKRDITITKYKYSKKMKRVQFKHASPVQNITVLINSTGRSQIILSKPSGRHLNEQNAIDFVKSLMGSMPDDTFEPKFEIPAEDRIENIRSMQGVFKKNTRAKPQVCIGKNRLVPKPYTFSGNCIQRDYAVDDNGTHYKKARNLRVRNIDRYGPCCYKINGKSPGAVNFNVKTFPVTFVRKDQGLSKRALMTKIDKIINKSTGKRKVFVRRIVYGFPNNKYPKDKATVNDLEIDNKAANYKPGSKIIDRRSYKGLLELINKDKSKAIRKILKCYSEN
jgi:hypothetical protein